MLFGTSFYFANIVVPSIHNYLQQNKYTACINFNATLFLIKKKDFEIT